MHACSVYMEAVSIKNNKSHSQTKTEIGIELSVKDYFAIKVRGEGKKRGISIERNLRELCEFISQEVHSEPDIFSLLVRSLCPNIYGHEMVKAGLLLSLFGGSSKHASLRDDIHVLIIGDPGLGKSQMLQASARVAAKGNFDFTLKIIEKMQFLLFPLDKTEQFFYSLIQGVYICGNSSTRSGLTVTLTREAGSKDFALEPGALVLADRGCCLIDEFDKMPTQHKVRGQLFQNYPQKMEKYAFGMF